jgi:hypothetical protein
MSQHTILKDKINFKEIFMVNIKGIIEQQSAAERSRLNQIEADSISRKEWLEGWPGKIKEITNTLISEMTDNEFKSFVSGVKDGYIFYTIKYNYRPGIDYSNDSLGHKWIYSILEYNKSLLPKLTYPHVGMNSIFTPEIYNAVAENINEELKQIFNDVLEVQFIVEMNNFMDEEENEQYSASLIMMFKLDI